MVFVMLFTPLYLLHMLHVHQSLLNLLVFIQQQITLPIPHENTSAYTLVIGSDDSCKQSPTSCYQAALSSEILAETLPLCTLFACIHIDE